MHRCTLESHSCCFHERCHCSKPSKWNVTPQEPLVGLAADAAKLALFPQRPRHRRAGKRGHPQPDWRNHHCLSSSCGGQDAGHRRDTPVVVESNPNSLVRKLLSGQCSSSSRIHFSMNANECVLPCYLLCIVPMLHTLLAQGPLNASHGWKM